MTTKNDPPYALKKSVRFIERLIIKTLIALMALLLVLATIELVYTVYSAVTTGSEGTFIINLDNLMNVFGVFLLVVIGIELLDTIKVYFRDHVIHVEVVLLVAVIAIARKIIVMDFEKYTGMDTLGIAALMIAVAGGYMMIKRAGGCGFWGDKDEEVKDIVYDKQEPDEGNRIVERTKTVKTRTRQQPSGEQRSMRGNPNVKDLRRGKGKPPARGKDTGKES